MKTLILKFIEIMTMIWPCDRIGKKFGYQRMSFFFSLTPHPTLEVAQKERLLIFSTINENKNVLFYDSCFQT